MNAWKRIGKAISVIIAIAPILIVAVLFHEIGHLLAFRYNNINVETVNVGFPINGLSMVFWEDGQGTKYQISPILLGGYTIPMAESLCVFEELELLPKIIISLVGPVFNFLFAAVLISFYLLIKRSGFRRFPRILNAIKFASFINSILGIFNLVIVIPMSDGGNIALLLLTPLLRDKAAGFTFGLGFVILIFLIDGKIYRWLKRVYKIEKKSESKTRSFYFFRDP